MSHFLNSDEYVVGITTAPRRQATLDITIESLRCAGFNKFCVFAEPGSEIPDGVISRKRSIVYGAWQNWFYGLKELYETFEQPYYIMCQDDIQLCEQFDVKSYVDSLPLTDDIGLYSLYTPEKYVGPNEWNEIQAGSSLHMAQVYVFPRSSIPLLLNSREVWRFPGNHGIDCRVGTWAKYQRKKVLYRTPSLFNHIGRTSTIWDSEWST